MACNFRYCEGGNWYGRERGRSSLLPAATRFPLLLGTVRNVIGACASEGRATKNIYVETAINEKKTSSVVRGSLGLRGLPIASSGEEMAGRVIVDDISDRVREAKVIGKEERLVVRWWTMVV